MRWRASRCSIRRAIPWDTSPIWRESDRTLIVGDVLGNMNFITAIPGLNMPPDMFTPDPARNRESARRLAELRPALACFGHGAPLRDPGKLAEFVAKLPD